MNDRSVCLAVFRRATFCVVGTAAIAVLPVAGSARADWTANVGYHNPYGSSYGLNFLYWGQKLGFEIGVGWVDVDTQLAAEDEKDEDGDIDANDKEERRKQAEARVVVAGEADLRYFLSSGNVSPYVQGGFGLGLVAKAGEDDSGANADLGGGFAGLGLMLGSKAFHGYAALNLSGSNHSFLQAGLGIDI